MNRYKTQITGDSVNKFQPGKIGVLKSYLFWLRTLPKKTRVAVLLSVITLASVAGSILPFIPTNTAYAAPSGVYEDSTLAGYIKAYAYRNAIIKCFEYSGNHIYGDVSSVTSGKWFNGSEFVSPVAVSHLVNNSTGGQRCTEVMPQALTIFGWGSYIEAACALQVIQRTDNSDCVGSTASLQSIPTSRDKLTKIIDDLHFDGKAELTPPMKYLLYARSMEIGCRATPADSTPDLKALSPSDPNTWELNVVTGKKAEIARTIYISGSGFTRDRGISTITNLDAPNNFPQAVHGEISCINLVIEANKLAQAYKDYVDDPINAANEGAIPAPNTDITGPASGSTCTIEKIGWILCPIVDVGAKIVDGAYKAVAAMLTIPAISTDTNDPMYKAWSVMRNFANVAFVIAFLIIIYSQITGAGIGNYGIKKLLPRILVAAILVNISFWICAIAVDLSNILGSSIKGLFDGLSVQLYDSSTPPDPSSAATSGRWQGLVVGALAAGALLYITFSALLPMLVVALFAIVTVMLVLTLRQALIIMLIVISPLAFVAYLLPNTAGWFTKWRQLFQTLLLMFPIIAMIFGGSALASVILEAAANTPSNENIIMNTVLKIMAAGVTIIPLLITPVVMKTAGGLLNRFGGIVNNPNKGPFDRMRRGAEGIRDRRKETRLANAADPNKRFHMPLRGAYTRRKDRNDKTHKAKMSAYENRLQSQWDNSKAGQAATDTLKSTQLQNDIDKAAAAVRFNATGNLDLQLKAKVAKMEVDASESSQDAILKEISSATGSAQHTGVSSAVRLAAQNAANAKNLNDLRTGSAQRVLQQEQAMSIEDLRTGDAQYAGGIDKYGAQRAVGNATTVMHKAFDEAVVNERNTMTSEDASVLETIMKDVNVSEERRSAAASQILKVGSDKNIQDVLTYLGTTTGTTNIQKQVAADIGSRKPTSIGNADISNLAKGVYSGTFEEKIRNRIGAGKLSAEDLAKTSADELNSIITFLQANGPAMRADPNTADAIKALEADINEFRSNPQLKGRQPAFEIGSRMEDIHDLL